jgi:hypothetical protein
MKRRLTEEGFRLLMKRMGTDREFRRRLLSGTLTLEEAAGTIPGEDTKKISRVKWDSTGKYLGMIDEKLVLCSSSGY